MTDALLLDTCALLWLASDNRALSEKTRSMIENAQVLYVSPVTAWEIAVKVSKGKIQLPLSPRKRFDGVVKLYDITVLKLMVPMMTLAVSASLSHASSFCCHKPFEEKRRPLWKCQYPV